MREMESLENLKKEMRNKGSELGKLSNLNLVNDKKIKNEIDMAIQNIICIKNPNKGNDGNNEKKIHQLTKTTINKNNCHSPNKQK